MVGSDRTLSTLRQTLQDRNFYPESSVKHDWAGVLPEYQLQPRQTDLNPVPQTIFVA
jgi:hypothetical protein